MESKPFVFIDHASKHCGLRKKINKGERKACDCSCSSCYVIHIPVVFMVNLHYFNVVCKNLKFPISNKKTNPFSEELIIRVWVLSLSLFGKEKKKKKKRNS